MCCSLCHSQKLRISKIRIADLSRLLLLRFPVRCSVCEARENVGIFKAIKIYKAASVRRNARKRRRKEV
jgi:hypothetical protein